MFLKFISNKIELFTKIKEIIGKDSYFDFISINNLNNNNVILANLKHVIIWFLIMDL